jgi:hypothetical protein
VNEQLRLRKVDDMCIRTKKTLLVIVVGVMKALVMFADKAG